MQHRKGLLPGDHAAVTEHVWCMDSKESLAQLQSLAVQKDYKGMESLFRLNGVADLEPGTDVAVLDGTMGGAASVRGPEGGPCWTVINALRKQTSKETADLKTPGQSRPFSAHWAASRRSSGQWSHRWPSSFGASGHRPGSHSSSRRRAQCTRNRNDGSSGHSPAKLGVQWPLPREASGSSSAYPQRRAESHSRPPNSDVSVR